MSIQNEFLQFYNFYKNQIHYLIKTKIEYEFLCRKNQVFHQIDLFNDNKSEKNLEKYLQYWFHYEKQLNFYLQQLKQSQVISVLSFSVNQIFETQHAELCVGQNKFLHNY